MLCCLCKCKQAQQFITPPTLKLAVEHAVDEGICNFLRLKEPPTSLDWASDAMDETPLLRQDSIHPTQLTLKLGSLKLAVKHAVDEGSVAVDVGGRAHLQATKLNKLNYIKNDAG